MLLLLACTAPGVDKPDETGAAGSDTDTGGETDTNPPACGAESSERLYCGSCAELLAVWPGSADGPATLDVGGLVLDTFCEMTTSGGGWTLLGTNTWTNVWNNTTVLDTSVFGAASLTEDFKSEAFSSLAFSDLLFETDLEFATYVGVGDGRLDYQAFQQTVPLSNCGIDTIYEWEMHEGTLEDPDLCGTNLYIHPIDWEGGLIPCGDTEVAVGPAWSGKNKDLGCPLNDPRGTSFIEDPWGYNPWGDHDPAPPNAPLRMWAR